MNKKAVDCVANMVAGFLADEDIMTQNVRRQIINALNMNCHFTTTYALQVSSVQDIKGSGSAESGWYIILTGTRCGVRFFINNDMQICRKPNKNSVRIVRTYELYNHQLFSEGFWSRYF